jgi:hypothetical protein
MQVAKCFGSESQVVVAMRHFRISTPETEASDLRASHTGPSAGFSA